MRRFLIIAAAALLAACGSATTSGRPSAGSPTAPTTSVAPSTSSPASTPTPSPKPSTSARRTTSVPAKPTTRAAAPTTSSRPVPPLPTVSGVPTVVLNPGHNGGNATHTAEINRQVPAGFGEYKACDTTGTNTDAGYPEHAFTFDVSLRVRRILRDHGVHVVMTRTDDTGVGPCVDERAAIGNAPNVVAVVSIHADGAPSSGHGFHVNQDSRTPDGATQATVAKSDRLGRAIHAALVASSGLVPSTYIGQDGYYYRSDLAGLNLARRPATFLELGNMRNAGDAALLSSSSGRQQIAQAVAAGILAYLNG